jgi:hypothetical protein
MEYAARFTGIGLVFGRGLGVLSKTSLNNKHRKGGSMTAKYVIHYWFEWGGQCLWGGDQRTKEKYGDAIHADKLPLSEQTKRLLNEVGEYHDTALNWHDPMAPSPWSKQDEAKFGRLGLRSWKYCVERLETSSRFLKGKNFPIRGILMNDSLRI